MMCFRVFMIWFYDFIMILNNYVKSFNIFVKYGSEFMMFILLVLFMFLKI